MEELWKTHISDDPEEDQVLKKTIANCNYGMLEKQINRTRKSKLFDTYEDAKFFQTQYGGEITFIKQYEVKEGGWNEEGDEMTIDELLPTGKALFILNLSAESSLSNGFRYIKELLMQHHNFYLNNCRNLLRRHNVDVYFVKTDAFAIPAESLELAKELLNWEEGLGSWRLNRTEDLKTPYEENMISKRENNLIEVKAHETHPIDLTVEDEHNLDKLCGHFEEKRRVMIRGEFPGCGKSHACRHMEQRGHKVLYVCPTNKLSSNYGESGCTINKFFSIGMTEQTQMAKFDDSQYDTIVFDEIFFSSIRKLARIKRYCDEHPDKIVIATGDTSQLESIDCITNQRNYDEYYNECVDLIFPDNMYFKENTRLKNAEDKETLRELKQEIFDESIPVETTIRKYFQMVKTWNTIYNIAYRNATCSTVSNEVRSRILQKTAPYETGDVLICRSYLKTKRFIYNVNYEYTVSRVEGNGITLQNATDLPLDVVRKNFIHNHCRTCHSFQGSSIDDEITIFDWKFFHVDRKWIWTALTRATDLKKVKFYNYNENQESVEQMKQYFQKKVERYKQQDRRAKRHIDEDNYITQEILMGWVGKACNSCGDCLTYSRIAGKVDCNLTAQRIDCNEGHVKENVVPYCIYCNTAMSNRE